MSAKGATSTRTMGRRSARSIAITLIARPLVAASHHLRLNGMRALLRHEPDGDAEEQRDAHERREAQERRRRVPAVHEYAGDHAAGAAQAEPGEEREAAAAAPGPPRRA